MRLKEGDRLRCSNARCGIQVLVTDLGSGNEIGVLLHCACGFPMKKSYEKPAVSKIKPLREERAMEAVRRTRP
jgi:hypothetical protein